MSPTEEIRSADGRREWRTPSLCLLTARGDVDASGSAGVDSTTDRRNIAADDRRHEAGVDLFPADEAHIRGFHHRIGGFNHRHQTTAFDHSKCFRHAAIVPKLGHKKAQKAQKKVVEF